MRQKGIFGTDDPDKNTSLRPFELVCRDTCPFERFPTHLQEQSLLWVHFNRFSWRYAKKAGIEFTHIFLQKSGLFEIDFPGYARLRVIEVLDVESVPRNLNDAITTCG